ncbi:MAG: tetratricopeptide repeat protein [Planctomycetota bacterium]|jgi:Flp pilus assembly protein TadD
MTTLHEKSTLGILAGIFLVATPLLVTLPEARLGIAKLYNSAGMLDEAAYSEAVKLDPHNPEGHQGLAYTYELKGMTQEADKKYAVYEAYMRLR